MKNIIPIFIFALTFIVSGCSSTGVIPMGEGAYFIGKKDGSPGLGVSLRNKAEVYKEANEFCHKKGLDVKVTDEVVTPARLGRLGSTELQFKCISTETNSVNSTQSKNLVKGDGGIKF